MSPDDDKSLGDAATFAGAKRRPARDDVSLGDERTLRGGDAVGVDTILDDIEIVDLTARYTIEGTLGQGGMGAVLLATDTRLGRKVAIKRILGEAARSAVAILRFLTEAKAIAALNHPNIVQIYDYGRAKDGPFLIMEYVDGGSLADRCRQGAIPLEEAVELACQICDGLAKAHDAGIVHRDIKPANVLLNRDGLPKLTDFGLAKAEAADHGMTMTGAVMGTPDFMPPEQRRDASEVDHRSDLWSLAASVYQMVTGRSPKIIRFNDVPAALQDVLAKALEDRKDARYQSARELRDALKTSVRAAAAAVEELVQGQCPSCGVKNDSSRRFCRGCGESLEAPCLACTKPMPMWEEICGACGAKQAPLIDERRGAMAARQAEAEGLLGDFEFDRATAIAESLRDEPHPQLRLLAHWAETFLHQIAAARDEQMQHAVESIAEAEKHEAAFDYLSAVFALETIPDPIRAIAVPGKVETPARMLDRIKSKQSECRRLEAHIRSRLAEKSFDDLLPDVEKFLAVRPDRTDIQKIRTQLVERTRKRSAALEQAVTKARKLASSRDYEGAYAALSAFPATELPDTGRALLGEVTAKVQRINTLKTAIQSRVRGKNLSGLLDVVREYLALKPTDTDAAGLEANLIARDQQIDATITKLRGDAQALWRSCRFREAGEVYTKVVALATSKSEGTTATSDGDLIVICDQLAQQRDAALNELGRGLLPGDSLQQPASDAYHHSLRLHQLNDDPFRERKAAVEDAWNQQKAKTEAWQATKASLGFVGQVTVFVAATGASIAGIVVFFMEPFDHWLDDLVFRGVPIVIVSLTWLWFLKRTLIRS